MLLCIFLGALVLSFVVPTMLRAVDWNGDNLPDDWESQNGLSTNAYSASNLVGWWQMEPNTNGVIADRTINHITGTMSGFGSSPYVAGLFSNALAFTADAQASFSTNAALSSVGSQFTFSTWFQTTNTPTQAATIATLEDASANSWSLATTTNGVPFVSFVNGSGSQTVGPAPSGVQLYDGTWHQVAITYSTNHVATVYVDGNDEASGAITNWTSGSGATLTLGVSDTNEVNPPYNLDDTRLYNRALASPEVARLPVTYSDPNGSGLTVFEDYQEGLSPLSTNGIITSAFANSGLTAYYNNQVPTLIKSSGDAQTVATSTFAANPLVVLVKDGSGHPLVGAPITFTVGSNSSGTLAQTNGGAMATSLSLTTDGSGNATAYYQAGATIQSNAITATAVSGAGSVSVTFTETTQPVPVSGLNLWLRADAGITADGSGNVSEWADQGTEGENAAQTTSGEQPQIIANALNGKPVVRFNGSSDYLQMPPGFSSMSSGVTVFTVFNPSTSASFSRIFDIGNGNPQDNLIFYRNSDQPTFGFEAVIGTGTYDVLTGTSESKLNTPQEYTALLDGTSSMSLYQNGTLVGQVTGGLTTLNNVTRNLDYVGKSNWPDPLYQGDIAEILIYNRPLSSSERQQVEAYLADKYGLFSLNATWPLAYSSDIQAQISANQWNKAQADQFVSLEAANPSMVFDGLTMWLSAGAGVTADGSGNVSAWADETGNFTVTQGNSGNMPVVVANVYGGKPVLRFNGGQFLNSSASAANRLNGAMSIIAVAKTNTPNNFQTIAYFGDSSAYHDRGLGYFQSCQLFDTYFAGVEGQAAPSGFVTEMATLDSSGNIILYQNSTQTGTGSITGSNLQNLTAGVWIGLRGDGSGYWQGDIAEILVYDHVLSDSDREKVNGLLADKYGYYDPNATWILTYSSDIQALIAANQWTKAYTDGYMAFLATSPAVPASGLSLWFKADAGVTADGSGNVSQWVDQGPNQFSAAQSNSSSQPVLVTNAFNGKPALKFSGAQTLVGTGNIPETPSQGVTMIAVASTTSPGSQEYTVTLGSVYSGGINRMMGYISGEQSFSNCNSDADVGSAPASGRYVSDAATLATDGSSVVLYRNGTQTGTSTIGNTGTTTPGFSLGSFVGGICPWQGNIAEVLVYNRTLSSAELAQVDGYLSDKYGYYGPNSTWPTAYSSDVQAQIIANQWSKTQADNYVALQTNNPTMLTDGLMAWFKADAGVTYDGGNDVSAWADQTGNYTLTQSNGSNMPAYVANGLNGDPSLRFSGNQWINSSASMGASLNAGMTMVLVASTLAPSTQQYGFWLGGSSTGANRGIGYYNSAQIFDTSNIYSGGGPVPASGDFVVEAATLNSTRTAITLYQNGVATTTNSLSGVQNLAAGITIGDLNGTGFYNWQGDITEALVYNHPLTSTELQQVSVYLADKYGLYNADATWPLAYSSDVQGMITANQWNKAQADAYVAFATGNSSVPSPGLIVWLKADAGVAADGSGSVSGWADQSPLQNNAAQSNSGNQPKLISNALNGQSVIRFDGSSSFLTVHDNPSIRPPNSVTVIAVAAAKGGANQDIVAKYLTHNAFGWSWNPPFYTYEIGTAANDLDRGYVATTSGGVGNDLYAVNSAAHQPVIRTMIYDGSNQNIYREGVLAASQAVTGPIYNDDGTERDLFIGASGYTPGGTINYLNGDVAEVLVYNRALTSTEQQQAELYLANKYYLYYPAASWIQSYSTDVQAEIVRNQWSKAQADAYVAFLATSPGVPGAGLSVWLKADSNVTASGGLVSQWGDSGFLGNNANQSTSANQPTLVSNVVNGKPAVQFDGASSYLTITENASVHPSTGVTIVALAQTSGSGNQDIVAKALSFNAFGWDWIGPYYAYELGVIPNDTERGYTATDPGTIGNELDAGVGDNNQMDVMSMVYDGSLGSQSIYRKGISQGTTVAGSSLNYEDTSERDLTIGAAASIGIQNYLNGKIAEVLVYNRALSDTERQQAEGYLADKYGVYSPSATWPEAYSVDVQAEIDRNQWSKAQADAYVTFQSSNSTMLTDGLMLWLEADAGITQDGSGNVSQWVDQASGSAVTQGTTGSMPLYVASDINGKPSLRFSGSQALSSTAGLGVGLDQDITVIAVSMTTNPGAVEDSLYLGNGSTAGAARAIGYDYTEQIADFSGSMATGLMSPASNSFVTEAYTLDSSLRNVTFYRNGIATSATTAGSLQNLTNGITVGNRPDGSTPWQGDIAELLVFNHQLSSAEMNQVGGSLADKYGIYNPSATWPSSYSSDVQARITANQWNKSQADAYVAAHASSPSIVSSGLALWLKADAGITQDGNGRVTAWADQTGNYTLSQSGVSAPGFVTSDINGKPGLHFSGSQSLISAGTLAGLDADSTIITVAATGSPGATQHSIYLGAGSSFYQNRGIGYTSGQEIYDIYGSGTSAGKSPAANAFTTEITTLDPTLTNVTFYQNGNQTGTGTISGTQNLSAGIMVGGNPQGVAYWTGDINEVIVYSRQLSASEIQQVDGYLADKYGLFDPNATWPSTYSKAVEVEIFKHQWNKAQADQYVALQTNNPSMLTNGLSLWLRADAGVTTSAGNVTSITDQAGNQVLTQATTANEPAYVSSDVNGAPALRFSGTQWLANASAQVTGLNQDMTVVTVAMTTAPNSQGYSLYLGINNGTAGINRAVGYDGGGQFYDTAGSVGGSPAPAPGTFLAEEATLDSTLDNVTFYQNGIQTAQGALSGVADLSNGISLGAATGGSSGWQGDIAEVLVYDHQLSATELQQLQTYLINKYGLSGNAAAPTISPAGGAYGSTQSVTISTTLTSGTIHYTIDGTSPTASSPTYTTSISLSGSALLQAAVFSSNGQRASQVGSQQFFINDASHTGLAAAPTGLTVSVASGKETDLAWSNGAFVNYNQIYVYRSTNGGAYELITVLDPTTTTFADTTVTAGNSYTYKIGTANQSGTATSGASLAVNPSHPTPVTISITTPSGAVPLP